ncbi:MAG: hypothetical protein HY770_02485, partial [Chitinivibrionia bacterium]|nr:hypothetical protein [Chitinivibrionia bacterium]
MRKTGLLFISACACLILLPLLPEIAASKTGVSSLARIPFKGPGQVAALHGRGIDVVHVSPQGYMDVAAYPEDIEYLFSRGYPVSI